MPQEFFGLQCYHESCRMFQVVQKKRTNKWECKICHSKQSLKRIFVRSFKASDVRKLVQQYNLKGASQRENAEIRSIDMLEHASDSIEPPALSDAEDRYTLRPLVESKWAGYLKHSSSSDEEELEPLYTTTLPDGRGGKGRQRKRKRVREPSRPASGSRRPQKLPSRAVVHPKFPSDISTSTAPAPRDVDCYLDQRYPARSSLRPSIRAVVNASVQSRALSQPLLSDSPTTVRGPKVHGTGRAAVITGPSPSTSKWSAYQDDDESEESDDELGIFPNQYSEGQDAVVVEEVVYE